jgi:DNA-binding NarL/FixJ family response regulator
MARTVAEMNPDVLLLSVRKLDVNIIEELEKIRTLNPRMGIVILIVFYSSQDIELLRRLALCGESGMALFLKQSLDKVEQLCRTIIAVSQGQVILDPPLATFMFAGKPECPFLKQLTSRELEILSLLSQGYTNSAIAETLFIDIKTVEHHLNSMYSKLKTDPDYNSKHLRVSAARLYLESMGTLYQKEETLVRAISR